MPATGTNARATAPQVRRDNVHDRTCVLGLNFASSKRMVNEKRDDTTTAEPMGGRSFPEVLGSFLQLLSKLADSGDGWRRTGEVGTDDGRLKSTYDVSVRLGSCQPASGTRVAQKASPPGLRVQASREPVSDVFDEGDHIRVVMHMPGVAADTIRYYVHGDILQVEAGTEDQRYRSEVALGAAVLGEAHSTSSYQNGTLEINLRKEPEVNDA